MKSDLLPYYERELFFIRQMAGEFASRYPDKAGRLGVQPDGAIDDPHVERLMEAFAFSVGRIQHKIDDEFPEITEAILGLLYPHFLSPVPSMSVVQFAMDPEQSKASEGHVIDRHSRLNTRAQGGVSCAFRTCYPVTLWPIEVTSASFVRSSAALLAEAGDSPYAIRIEIRCLGGLKFSSLSLDKLNFFVGAQPANAFLLYELLFNNVARVILRSLPQSGRPVQTVLPRGAIHEVGFARDEGMLPYSERSFLGYAMLQEYLTFPEKFLFFDLAHLDQVNRTGLEERFEILILLKEFGRKDVLPILQQSVSADSFQLGCAPVVNLFSRTAEPIRITQTQTEYRVVPDIHFESATEVYSVDRVLSTTPHSAESQIYQPFYSLRHSYGAPNSEVYWNATRRPSGRKGDKGTEVYLSLLDLNFKPQSPPVETLTVNLTCTNRDQVEKSTFGRAFGEIDLESGALVRVRFLLKLTATLRPPTRRGLQWGLISHLSLNHLSIVDGGVESLREILSLYDFSGDPSVRNQIAGLAHIASAPHTARVISENGVVFARGIRVAAEFDEDRYTSSGVFLFGSVLEKFLGLYSAINSFSQLSIASRQRTGVIKTWPPRAGEQIVL